MERANHRTITARINTDNRVKIPKEIRTKLKLQAKDDLVFEILNEDTVILRKKSPNFWELAANHFERYGRIHDKEIIWGDDHGAEIID